MVSTDRQIGDCASLADLLSTSTDLITFASAVSSGNAKILKVLAQAFGIVALETSA